MHDLSRLIARWPVEKAAVGVTDDTATLGIGGDIHWVKRIASISKVLAGLAGLVALEEGTIALDEPAGPEGSTVRHLLSHASGLAFDEHRVLSEAERRRIYSNAGIEQFAVHLATKAGMPFDRYLREAVLLPLGMDATELRGSPAHGVHSNVEDLLCLARELLAPRLIAAETLEMAASPHFPGLRGVVPGLGSFDPNPWGLALEIRGDKDPHWTGVRNSPRTFGHFGGSGTFLWVDPVPGIACVGIADREFGPWALEAWPGFSDDVLKLYG